jgi:hypothetical protein
MRLLILAALPIAALFAQEAPPPPAEQAQPKTEAPTVPAWSAKPTAVTPKPLDPAVKAVLERTLRELREGRRPVAIVTAPGSQGRFITLPRRSQPCAVPLTNMLHPVPAGSAPNPLPVIPGDPGAVPLKEVTVPAPSCDDVK